MKYLNEKQVAEMIGISLPTLRNDRAVRQRLPFVKFGKSVRYSEADVVAFMESRKIETAHLTGTEKVDFLARLQQAKATLNVLKSQRTTEEVYSLAEEMMSLVESLFPGIKKTAQELPGEEDEDE